MKKAHKIRFQDLSMPLQGIAVLVIIGALILISFIVFLFIVALYPSMY